MFYIYRIINLLNEKKYFGQTNNPALRWSQYKYNVKNIITDQVVVRAMIKYGWDNFKFEVCGIYYTQDEVNTAEEEYIELFETRNPKIGYNVDRGGGVGPRSSETIQKVVVGLKKYYETHDGWNKGKKMNPESKRKISESSMGKPGTNTGKKFDDEWRVGISKATAGKVRKDLRRFSEEVEKEICLLYEAEWMSTYTLERQFDCYRSTIKSILVRNGVEIRQSNYNGHSNSRNIFTKEQELEICKLYETRTVTRAELARKYSCGKTTIRDVLLRNGVKL